MDKLLYEIIPPPASWSEEKVEDWTQEICRMLKRQQVDSVNLPEVVDESREEERTVPFLEKVDNFTFARYVKGRCPSVDPIPSKICVRSSADDLSKWARRVDREGMNRIVLVGRESRDIAYPGPSVLEAARMIKADIPYMKLGGITIFTRTGESQRMMRKMESGVDFFLSQIIFETANVKCVLLDLQKLCREAGRKMPCIYLSLAPASSKVEVEFMKWLGVEFPTAVWSYFMEQQDDEIEEKVFDVLEFNLDDLVHFLDKTGFEVGFNVEQIMYKGQESGERLLQLVKSKVGHCL